MAATFRSYEQRLLLNYFASWTDIDRVYLRRVMIAGMTAEQRERYKRIMQQRDMRKRV